ncbi:MAG: SpoIIE family protein phosphatase [Candidatus Aminicenantes bacterium]|nr:SpoIIE family protein phosphatase [Candidatus Aminicenantes bacterium]NIM77314.1 SpoIIE family protein phosphatase [Candidatus Aminicenantes bacterium]NIN16615.1 SpoIIE family protein phosphatase [Candidatus Aminicenantes bacterium]NIN40473.1 SpoIIE family protein phosphatase [Candidatus Aminicenantes bacterium]NIN83293.1 SpoIIE family protein phosphatase [Candidatus Aminicenantes bacterium]
MFSRLRTIDIFIGILLVLTILSYFFLPGIFKIVLWVLIISVIIRLLVMTRRGIFWKIRNRLIFSALFLVVTPICLITIFFIFVGNVIIAQYGAVIINNMIADRINRLDGIANMYLSYGNPRFMSIAATRFVTMLPNLNILFWEKQENSGTFRVFFKYPKTFNEKKIVPGEFKGYFKVNNKLYHGVLNKNSKAAALLALEITQDYLDNLLAISDFRIRLPKPRPGAMNSPSTPGIDTSSEPESTSVSDDVVIRLSVLDYTYLDFDTLENSKPVERTSNFLLISDSSKIYQKIESAISHSGQGTIKKVIYGLIILFGTFIIASLIIGFRMVGVITRSINQLTRGTQRIRNGDFSFRIKTRSRDQMQYLADSFNEMAAGIDRLLIDEKEKQRLEEELRIARSIQLKLLPCDIFDTNEFEIAAVNIPAAEIAGDYFDYFYKENAYLSLLVADVSGKGASAAFYMAELKGVINHLYREVMSPASLIAECHYSLKDSFDKITYITLNVAQFRIPEKKFLLSRAGHTPAIFFNAQENECLELHPDGMAIGLITFARDKLKEVELPFQKGDILLLFSDGLTEIMNKEEEMLGIDQVKHLILENHYLSAEEIKQKILDFSIEFSETGVSRDDLTFIILKVK